MAGAFRAAVNRAIPWLLFGSVLLPAGGAAVAGILVLALSRRGGDIALGILVIVFGVAVLAGTIISLALLRRQNRMARVQAEFISRVSHELRTPMASIRMGIETLKQERFESESERRAFMDMIDVESRRLAGLVEHALGYKVSKSVPDGDLVKSCPVGELLMLAAAPFRIRPDTRDCVMIEIEPGAGEKMVFVDSEQFCAAVSNLIVNALTHGHAGPDKPVELVLSSSTGLKGRPFVRIECRDRGPGVGRDPEKVFEGFYRGRTTVESGIPGLGLGLAIVRGFARSAAGDVTVESRQGYGAVFVMTLPESIE